MNEMLHTAHAYVGLSIHSLTQQLLLFFFCLKAWTGTIACFRFMLLCVTDRASFSLQTRSRLARLNVGQGHFA